MDPGEPVRVDAISDLDHRVGMRVLLQGSACNAKGGAVLDCDDFLVYMHRLESWPASVLGKTVQATGILARRKEIPDPVIDSCGGVSQGAWGEQYLLENAIWEPK